jgi:hypothetical protein
VDARSKHRPRSAQRTEGIGGCQERYPAAFSFAGSALTLCLLVERWGRTHPRPSALWVFAGNQSDPCHLFGRPRADHDYYFELPAIEERDAQSITRCSTAHQRDVRAVPRANRTCSADSPIPGASSNTDELSVSAPSLLWRFPSPPHHQVNILAAPFWRAARCDLRRFYQQEAQPIQGVQMLSRGASMQVNIPLVNRCSLRSLE